MTIQKIFIFFVVSWILGFWGCTKEQKVESPRSDQIEKSLIPSKAEVRGSDFLIELKDLKVVAMGRHSF